ncbi:hypothetical protein [Solibacillus sp. FSL K6-1523]|uniref:hypothetical protein n=1 Tax=Solibacillus sp. FSL K6-1523 TaxID=2921471 RepID=UPI0030F7FA2A
MTNYRLTPLKNTEENRQRIIEKTRGNMQKPPIKKPSKTWVPVVITTIALFMAVFLAVPYVQQAFFDEQNFTIEKVVIPNVQYTSLVDSTYLDETNEFIYNTENGFFAFDVETQGETLLVDTSEIARVFDYAVSKDWLVWAQPVNNERKIHVLNRETHEVNIMETPYFYGIQLQGDTVVYTGFQDNKPYTFTLNLNDGTSQILREIEGEGSSSWLAFEGNQVVFSEVFKMEDGKNTVVTVHDLEMKKKLESYVFPYDIAENILLKGDKIYSYLWNENDDEPAAIGFIDRTTGDFNVIEKSVGIHDYATDGEHFAVAVEKGESNTVQLFALQEGELKLLSKLPSIRERLVLPRFTEQGTLVVNGEGMDKAMYLIRFNKESK